MLGKENDKKYQRGRCVVKMDKDGKIISIFNNAKEASAFSQVHKSGILQCCGGTQKTSGGFKWKYQ